MMVPNFLMKRASLTPDRIAIETDQEKLTFAQLNERSMELASKLSSQNIRKGDSVSVFMKNSLEMVLLLFSLKHLGAITVLHNLRLTPMEIAFQTKNSKSKLLVTDIERVDSLLESEVAEESNIISMDALLQKEATPFPIVKEFHLDSVDTIMYTSGTTGNPKGVKQTYGNHFWSASGSALNLGLYEKDAWLAAVPLFHISGLSILMRSVIYGMRVILHEKFNAQKVNDDIKNKGVTIVSVVSTMLQQLLEDLGEGMYPATFRCMLAGGGPIPLPVLKECEKRGIPVFQTYGMTETCSQIVTLSPEAALLKIGSAGKALFSSQIKIVVDGDCKEAHAGEAGEILVKGPNVTPGYFHDEEATKRAFNDGWLHTGDIGYLDEDGFLYVLDRRSDLIISGGENVYPAEIEAVLMSHPSVKDAGVGAMEDDRWGQVPVAYVVLKGQDVSESEIIDFASQRLAKYKVPKKIVKVIELPHNASNKLVRRRLVEYLPKSDLARGHVHED
ncbi:o-succinylbenzoate--CoA ligase [Bacillus tianshenii]|uniref:o-succinylbenzoate--CoA ligase n=1 Tax=Sutcliffiella tianshenii TaxID=1463404 RepID=UPI001CD26774|nr:o-succinylbenzoate--CoA ligase [Bacillus tianshenii]MCA1320005.1 o-succinylbenzoate--CoA ligase [Bacillus tianshenii]